MNAEFQKMPAGILRVAALAIVSLSVNAANADETSSDAAREFFEKRIRPLLVRHCYECHSSAATRVAGGLRLDYRDGILEGGESGAAIVPGDPQSSLLISAVRHEGLQMPPASRLSSTEIRDLEQWVTDGAFDPRATAPAAQDTAAETFEANYQTRRNHWSLRPAVRVAAPEIHEPVRLSDGSFLKEPLTDIDRFVIDRLQQQKLSPATKAAFPVLIRRLFFTLTGLPPSEEQIQLWTRRHFDSNVVPELIDELLKSPHFGERWARHWMDVVRYTDTYGYEWDMPAKGAWRYRDYLIRAFNADVPFDQLVREHLAGDLLELPRTDHVTQINESVMGLMFFQMGEKRHGDSAEFNGIHQEMLDNKIDAFGKAFLATTIACARCHDHKLDPISQQDYYALGAMFFNSRWLTSTADLTSRHEQKLARLSQLKKVMRPLIADRWLTRLNELAASQLNERMPNRDTSPDDPWYPWMKLHSAVSSGQHPGETWTLLKSQLETEQLRRTTENQSHFAEVADFRDGIPDGWSVDGVGLRQITSCGDFIVSPDDSRLVDVILHGGLCTNTLSPRMNGALRSPLTRLIGSGHLSFEIAGGDFACQRVVVDNAFLTERQQYLNNRLPRWQRVDSPGSLTERNVYVEFATKTSNPNFPPRVGLGGACSEEQTADPKSWFQISRVVRHAAPFSPHPELTHVLSLFRGEVPNHVDDAAERYREALRSSIQAWRDNAATDDDVRLLNWMLTSGLIHNAADDTDDDPLHLLADSYRRLESELPEPETINGMKDVDSPQPYRLNIRGEYDDLGDPIAADVPRFLRELCGTGGSSIPRPHASRLELAERTAAPTNPLTARVYVNRVWHWLFGAGLVATTDDFGHAGESPTHPELLDYLTLRFIDEGWSTKELIRSMVSSYIWQQSQLTDEGAVQADPTNQLLHHYPVRRLDAESLRDAILAASGRLDLQLYGAPVDPFRLSEDPQKRLFSGPLDGNGRRSVYTKVTIMEPPRFLAAFNQPAPKIPTGRRDVTTTPSQSLTLLNDPFVISQAEYWADQLVLREDPDVATRIAHMFRKALSREPDPEELHRWCEAVKDLSTIEQTDTADVLMDRAVWAAVSHSLFNTKEFGYLR